MRIVQFTLILTSSLVWALKLPLLDLEVPEFTAECSSVIQEFTYNWILGDSQANIQNMMPYFYLSGKGINQFGDYTSCQEHYQYVDLGFTYKLAFGNGVYIGICLTKKCTIVELNQNMEFFKEIIFKLKIDKQLEIENLESIDFKLIDPSSVYPEKTFSYYLTVIIIGLLSFLAILLPMIRIVKLCFKNKIYQDIELLRTFELQNSEKAQNFLQAFSLIENCKDLFEQRKTDPNLAIFDGLRVIAFFMVVYGHQYLQFLLLVDLREIELIATTEIIEVLSFCFYSVDIFFWVGGFFVGFVLTETKKINFFREKGIFAIFQLFFMRLLRLWPIYIFTIFTFWKLMPQIGKGPRWIGAAGVSCQNWWEKLFFIYVYTENKDCTGWTWYLDDDVFLFFVGSVIIYLYSVVSKQFGKIITLMILTFTQIWGLLFSLEQKYKIPFYEFTQPKSNFFDDYYIKPWFRAPPYFLGLFLGILYREYKIYKGLKQQPAEKPAFLIIEEWSSQSTKKLVLLYLICYGGGATIIWYLAFDWYDKIEYGVNYYSETFHAYYWAFCRLAFTFGLSLICIINFIGRKDFFNSYLMNNHVFSIIAKLTFSGYMIHFVVLIAISCYFYEQPSLDSFTVIQYFIGDMIIILAISILMYLIIEIPINKLIQNLFAKKSEVEIENLPKIQIELSNKLETKEETKEKDREEAKKQVEEEEL